MSRDVEEILMHELHEVVHGLEIPAMPTLTDAAVRHRWQPLLVAAVVLLIVAGAATLAASILGGRDVDPAPPTPTPTRSDLGGAIPRTAPTVPYVLDRRLYVDGVQVPGSWLSVDAGDAGWVALRQDLTWWYGRGPEPTYINLGPDDVPVISPNGEHLAVVSAGGGVGRVIALDTAPGSERRDSETFDLGDPGAGDPVRVRAVTDDGWVVAQGAGASVLWVPETSTGLVDLASTAPGQEVLAGTPAGLDVRDVESGESFLAELSETGELTPTVDLPAHDDVLVSRGSTWLVWTLEGTTQGEVTSIPTLETQRVDGTWRATLAAPAGWAFRTREWAWEDDVHLIAPVTGKGADRLVRCRAEAGRCVLIRSR